MNLEILLILGCHFSNSNAACSAMQTSYIKYEGLDKIYGEWYGKADKLVKENVNSYFLLTAGAFTNLKQRKVSAGLGHGLSISASTSKDGRNTNATIRYEIGF